MKRLTMIVSIFSLLLICNMSLFSQQSEEQRRRDVLRFGLEGEVAELISQIKTESTSDYNQEIIDVFSRTRSSIIRESVIDYCTDRSLPDLKQWSLEVLEDPFDYKRSTVSAVFRYVEKLPLNEAAPLVRKLMSDEGSGYRELAISTLGKIGGPEDAVFLAEYLDSEISGDEKQRLVIRQNVMTALGELKSEAVWEQLMEIASDEDENTVIRATAAKALGSIGKIEAIDRLSVLYESNDPLLRAASVNALSNYTDERAQMVITESFKDTHYKVRLEALEAASKGKIAGIGPYILYRAKTDPVEAVKMRSFEILSTVGGEEGISWLTELMNEQKTPDKFRLKAITVLFSNHRDRVFNDVEKIALETLKDDKKNWLRYECGKLFSKAEDSRLESLSIAYIQHKDTVTKSLGMEMYAKNRFSSVKDLVQTIADNDKMGGLQGRAKRILEAE